MESEGAKSPVSPTLVIETMDMPQKMKWYKLSPK